MVASSANRNIEHLVIVGTGLMATGIAQVSIASGIQVTLVGRSTERCEMARAKITAGINSTARRKFAGELETQQKFAESALSKLNFSNNVFESNLARADMVIEAIVENLKVKQKLFAELENAVSSKCILVTNTSSFLLKDVSSKLGHLAENFAGLHFFNPVPAMKLVEVVRGDQTSDVTFNSLVAFCQRIGKTAVKCKDSPGFIVNRLLMPYLADAIRLLECGAAEMRDIDTAMRLGAGHPMGPFELMDYIGLDTMKFILDGWHQQQPDDPRFVPSETLDKLVEGGKLGRKTAEGFHRYAK
ncbi:3-hydroxyacyl-CoA dehydrogenase, NAD binding domain-containing protein [Ditylenchus destructor]|nr:3-hydroxyacyl-CoA dehydrogenase, NAD binding domain-containing protein [Ditylenchus destructor]